MSENIQLIDSFLCFYLIEEKIAEKIVFLIVVVSCIKNLKIMLKPDAKATITGNTFVMRKATRYVFVIL